MSFIALPGAGINVGIVPGTGNPEASFCTNTAGLILSSAGGECCHVQGLASPAQTLLGEDHRAQLPSCGSV